MIDFADAFARAGLPTGRVTFAFNPVNTLRHLASDAAFIQHFGQMAKIMAPGGLYVVGLSLVDYAWLEPDEDIWVGARGRCRVTQLVNYLPPEPGTVRARHERVISHLTVSRPRGEEHFDDAYDLHCCNHSQWQNLLRKASVTWLASCDAYGQPLVDQAPSYQLEVLRF